MQPTYESGSFHLVNRCRFLPASVARRYRRNDWRPARGLREARDWPPRERLAIGMACPVNGAPLDEPYVRNRRPWQFDESRWRGRVFRVATPRHEPPRPHARRVEPAASSQGGLLTARARTSRGAGRGDCLRVGMAWRGKSRRSGSPGLTAEQVNTPPGEGIGAMAHAASSAAIHRRRRDRLGPEPSDPGADHADRHGRAPAARLAVYRLYG